MVKLHNLVNIFNRTYLEANNDSYKLLNEVDIVQSNQQLRQHGHVIRLDKETLAKRVFNVRDCENGESKSLWSNR